ncbi:nicotinate-nucleotide--dimethylbenzimidazole phosphoribosyltransferase, partial [Escherichia coli]
GGAAINAFSGVAQSTLEIVDAGVASPLPLSDRLVSLPVARGTRNFAAEPAMTRDEAMTALAAGAARVRLHASLGT